jgi:hypothetical protein
MKLFDIAYRLAMKIVNPLAQSVSNHNPEKTITPGMPETLRHAAAQGAVLLENRVLPFADGTHVAVFGRVQQDWFCAGYGSGGDVNFPYSVSLLEGLRSTDKKLLEMAKIYRISWGKRLLYIYAPHLRSYLMSACSVALGLSWKSGIAAEVIGIPDGSIGERLYQAKVYLATRELFAWTVVIILLSVLVEKLFIGALKLLYGRLERL